MPIYEERQYNICSMLLFRAAVHKLKNDTIKNKHVFNQLKGLLVFFARIYLYMQKVN